MQKGLINRSNIFYSSLIIVQCLIFGLSFIAVKSLLENTGMPTFLLIAVRFAIGAIFLFATSKLLNYFPKVVERVGYNNNFSQKELVSGLIAGAVLFAAFALQTAGANTTTPAKNALFTDLFVIFVPVITMLLARKFSLKPLLTSGLAFVGVMFIINIFSEEASFGVGDLLSLLCGVTFAVHFVVLEKFSFAAEGKNRLNPYNFTVIQLVVVSVLGLIFSLSMELNQYAMIDWGKAIGWLLFLGILSSAVAYLLQFIAQEKIAAQTTALLSCSEVIFAMIFALAFGFDKFSWLFIGGAIIVIIAMVLSSTTFDKKKKAQKEISANEEKKE